MKKFATLLFATFLALNSTMALCQDEGAKAKDTAKTVPVKVVDDQAKGDDQVKRQANEEPGEANAVDEPIDPLTEIKDLVKKRQYAKAGVAIEKAIEKEPSRRSLQDYRGVLAGRFYSQRKFDDAFDQVEKRLQYMIANVDQQPVNNLVGATLMMRSYAMRAKRSDRAMELIDEAFEAVETATKDDAVEHVKAMGLMVPAKTIHFTSRNTPEEGRALLMKYLESLEAIELESEEPRLIAKGKYLAANMSIPNASPADRDMLDEFLTLLRESHADSAELTNEYVRLELAAIRGTYRSNPDYAKSHVDVLQSVLDKTDVAIKRLSSYERELESYKTRIASALRLTEMVGKAAPELDVAAWVNQGDTTVDSLKGKVVMLDFWSVWCGPCIATFPHLREWREEFGDKGFEIVGVTRYYNYTWDESAKRAKRSKETVSGDAEQDMLKSFLEFYELKHPTIVTPKNSSMQKEFGVTGIPHVVLIGRDGKVQLVKVGSGASTAEAIHKKLVELIAQ